MRGTLSEVLENLEADQGIEMPMDPEYWEKLHSRIMAAVDVRNEQASPPWFEKPRKLRPVPSWRANLLPISVRDK